MLLHATYVVIFTLLAASRVVYAEAMFVLMHANVDVASAYVVLLLLLLSKLKFFTTIP
jgi:hypothetical protein